MADDKRPQGQGGRELARVAFKSDVKISLGTREVEGGWARAHGADLSPYSATLERDPLAGPVVVFRHRGNRDGRPPVPQEILDAEPETVPLTSVASYRLHREGAK